MTARRTKKRAPPAQPAPQHPARRGEPPAAGDESELSNGESLAEAESEIGQNDWIDPETGELAEGEAPPHLEGE